MPSKWRGRDRRVVRVVAVHIRYKKGIDECPKSEWHIADEFSLQLAISFFSRRKWPKVHPFLANKRFVIQLNCILYLQSSSCLTTGIIKPVIYLHRIDGTACLLWINSCTFKLISMHPILIIISFDIYRGFFFSSSSLFKYFTFKHLSFYLQANIEMNRCSR